VVYNIVWIDSWPSIAVVGCGLVCVTPSFKGKTECIDHVCARIKLHTCLEIVNTKISATRIKSYYMTKVLNEA
jgi:hypothetical protein